jgi:hypothetical protein
VRETAGFDDLGDTEKIKHVETELPAALAKIDDALARLAALRTEVEDPDGFARFTLGDDGRLLTLFIHEAARTSLTHLTMEQRLNALFNAGNEAMRLSRNEFWSHLQTP